MPRSPQNILVSPGVSGFNKKTSLGVYEALFLLVEGIDKWDFSYLNIPTFIIIDTHD